MTIARRISRTVAMHLVLLLAMAFRDAPAQSTAPARGRLVQDTVYSPALEGNLLGDAAARSVIVYLPPSYDAAPAKRYPVVYLLHGNLERNTIWTDGSYQGFRIQSAMDSLIASDAAREMIVVLPDAYNRYLGSHYANSVVAGNWADFIIHDLVRHIDRTYRTLAAPHSRGLAGHSMGGRGVLFLAMKFPGVFGAIYALSPGKMAFDAVEPFGDETWRKVLSLTDLAAADTSAIIAIAFSAAYSPNPRQPPFFVDLPVRMVDGRVMRVDSIWSKWIAHDPVALVESHAGRLRGLKGVRIDCGTSDELIEPNRLLSRILQTHRVPHVFEQYAGGHGDKIRERLEGRLLPYFSEILLSH